jgi:hypothetical protein
MKELLAENFWKNFVLRKTYVFENITSTSPPPPPPVDNIVRKNFCFPENFLGGALEWKGAQILEYTPQPETGWHGPEDLLKYSRDCMQDQTA